MNERERLAADLETTLPRPLAKHLRLIAADRLIALGRWRECPHCDPRHEWPCPTIARCDESGCEREATCGHPSPSGYRRVCGPHFDSIAKAFIEAEAARDALAGMSLLMGASSPIAASEAERLIGGVERAVVTAALDALAAKVAGLAGWDGDGVRWIAEADVLDAIEEAKGSPSAANIGLPQEGGHA